MTPRTIITGTSKTELTLNFTGVSQEVLEGWASKAIVAHLQLEWRKNGVPATLSVVVADIKQQQRGPRTSKSDKLFKLFEEITKDMKPEEKSAYIRKQFKAAGANI